MITIGITTRNRPEYLALALEHFITYSRPTNKIIIINDDSDCSYQKVLNNIPANYKNNISYHNNSVRNGIAKSKNECLKRMIDLNANHFFLFDDDCFPKKDGWEDCFINAAQKSNVHHLMFLTPFSIIQPIHKMDHITAYNNCAGVMLYLDKKVVETVGGFDTRFGFYGYEHAQYSKRIHAAKLSGNYLYNSPNNANDYIYSLDISFGWNQETPPLGNFDKKLYSSVTKEEAQDASNNSWLMNDFQIKVNL